MKLLIFTLFCAMLSIFSVSSQARVFIQSGVDTGRIVSLNADHSITLDNQTTYLPGRKHVEIKMYQVGELVSISYTLEEGKKVFFDLRKGAKSSSRPLAAPPLEKRSKHFK